MQPHVSVPRVGASGYDWRVLPLDGPGLARSLADTPPDTLVTAARVAWLPRDRDGPPGALAGCSVAGQSAADAAVPAGSHRLDLVIVPASTLKEIFAGVQMAE